MGQRVALARSHLRMTQAQLALATGVGRSTLNELEHGQRSKQPYGLGVWKFYAMAKALGLRIETLLGQPWLGGDGGINHDEFHTLLETARQHEWPDEDVVMLSYVQFRGRRPTTPAEWWFIYEAIRRTLT